MAMISEARPGETGSLIRSSTREMRKQMLQINAERLSTLNKAIVQKSKILIKIALFCLINRFHCMKAINKGKIYQHLIAIAVFLIVSILFNKPTLEGKKIRQADVQGYAGMAQQSKEFKEKYGHYPLWTESMFGGMPGYTIGIEGTSAANQGILFINKLLGLTNDSVKPISFFFLACICFYFLAQVLSINLVISLLGSIGFAFSTFNPILVSAGHETELIAIGFMPAVIASVLLILKKRYLTGTALLTLFFALQVSWQHLQVVYYTCLMIGIIGIVYLIKCRKEINLRHLLLSVGLIGLSLAAGPMTIAYTLLPTREYAAETMRGGKSQLTSKDAKNKTKGGLDKEYAFRWSYGIGETLTLFVPGMQGGGSAGKEISGSSKFADKLMEAGFPEENAFAYANAVSYWGDQPGTSGPVYLGAVLCFLFILGMVYVKSWHKWWILAICIAGVVLAWGRNLSALNYFLFDHLPFYSKFRAPSMSLIMPQLGVALLAALGLQQFVDSTEKKDVLLKKFKSVLYVSGGLVVLSLLIYFMSDFKGGSDNQIRQNFTSSLSRQIAQGKQPTPEMEQQASQVVGGWISALHDDRRGIFQADLLRSLIFVALAAGLCWFYLKDKIKTPVLVAGLLLLSSYDLLAEGKKYLGEDNYTDADNIDAAFTMNDADRIIQADKEKNFRVFDIAGGDPFQDSRISYYFNSVGGYHPAKLGLYNDLIEHQLLKGNQSVYNMLNTKYFIQKGPDGKPVAVPNAQAFGPCWLVSGIRFVSNADEEMAALDSTNLRDTVVVENSYKNLISFMPVADSSATIKLIENLNDKITYQFKAKTNQFAVFSEVYYDKGWDAFIDGKPAPYCRVNYVLRGMAVPAGDHTIEFRFEPHSYLVGNTISTWASLLTYLLLIGAILQWAGVIRVDPKEDLPSIT